MEASLKTLPTEDAVIRALLRPLSQDEFEQLKENVLADGKVIQPLVVWKETGQLIDGYHRAKIIRLHPELEWHTKELSFPDQAAVNRWVLGHQIGRRNLSGGALAMARVSLLTSGEDKTMREVADELCVSTKTVQRANEFMKMLDMLPHDLAEEVSTGKRMASQLALRRLQDFDEEMRERVFQRMRDNPSKSMIECMPVSKKVKAGVREEIPDLSPSVAPKIKHVDAKSIERFTKLSPTQKMVVEDVVAIGGTDSLAEAINLVQAPKSKPKLPPDVDKINNKIKDLFASLISSVDELAAAQSCTLSVDYHDTIGHIKAARSRWATWSGVIE